MDLSGHEGEIPMPISSTYVGTHETPQLHYTTSHGPQPAQTSVLCTTEGQHQHTHNNHADHNSKKSVVKYRECLKNHAASIGGTATDGCGEFMPSGEEGTLEALKCSACNCHRNFHRKETDDESSGDLYYSLKGRKLMNSHKGLLLTGPTSDPTAFGYNSPLGNNSLIPRPSPHSMIMPLGHHALQTSESDEMEGVGGMMIARPPHVKKRFRTKFTPEQKEKMMSFAEKVGWKLQRQEESVVQQFCQEIDVKRRVFKVWMHNNKHNLAKKGILQLE